MIVSVMYAMKHCEKLPMGRITTRHPYDEIRTVMRNKLYRRYPNTDYFRLVQYTINPDTHARTRI